MRRFLTSANGHNDCTPNIATRMLSEMKRSLSESWSPPGAGTQLEYKFRAQLRLPAARTDLVVGD